MSAERRFRARVVLVILACAFASACSTGSSWTIRKPLSSFSLPRATTIMLFRTPDFNAADTEGVSDALAYALIDELEKHGITSTLTALRGEPRLPRIELAFRRLEFTARGQYSVTTLAFEEASLVVDVGVVSPADEVVFVGRMVASAHRDRIRVVADAAGRKIAEDLQEAD
jgi:hypothetical protein